MITVNRRDLTAALKRALKLNTRTSSLPALRATQLVLNHENLLLRTTNLEQALVDLLPTSGKSKQAAICVPTAQLLSVVVALPQYMKDVVLQATHEYVLIGTSKLPAGCELADYPIIPRVPDDSQAIVELPEDFSSHLRFARAATSKDGSRFVLQGILFDFAHGNIVGCDGKRLHCAHLWNSSKVSPLVLRPDIVFDLDTPTRLVVPKPGKDDSVRQAFLYLANGYIATSTVEGDYPNYLSLVRKEHHLTATVDRQELAGAVEQAIPMTTERSPSCTLHLNEHFEIRAQHKDTGAQYVNEVSAELDGREMRIHLNPFQLLDTLRTMRGDTVTMAFRKPDEALYVVNEAGDHWALLMPWNVEAEQPTAPASR